MAIQLTPLSIRAARIPSSAPPPAHSPANKKSRRLFRSRVVIRLVSLLRDQLLDQQRGWLDILAESARRAVKQGHFRSDLDLDQFAHEFQALMLGYHHASRLMRDDNAETRVLRSFETLIDNAKE